MNSNGRLPGSAKEEFDHSLRVITQLHRRGVGGIEVGLALTKRLDTLVRQVYDEMDSPAKNLVAIVALGGYGRKELCPSSPMLMSCS